jgi:hypothetical protein
MHPPMFRQINQAFNVRGKPVIFCFGDTIYNPTGMTISPALRVHEGVHSQQQDKDPFAWWNYYIDDPTFRLDQELPAHRAEWQFLRDSGSSETALVGVATRLSSPLYGSLIDYEEARRLIAA